MTEKRSFIHCLSWPEERAAVWVEIRQSFFWEKRAFWNVFWIKRRCWALEKHIFPAMTGMEKASVQFPTDTGKGDRWVGCTPAFLLWTRPMLWCFLWMCRRFPCQCYRYFWMLMAGCLTKIVKDTSIHYYFLTGTGRNR